MNQAQKNQKIVDDALASSLEAQFAKKATVEKILSWFPDGGGEPWAEECFKRFWLEFQETKSSRPFAGIFRKVFFSRKDICDNDQFFELIEDWDRAIYRARNGDDEYIDFLDKKKVSEWILENFDLIDWHCRRKSYWRGLFRTLDEEAILVPKTMPLYTNRRRKWTWNYFKSDVITKANPSRRHIPKGWHSPPKSKTGWLKRVRCLVRIIHEMPGAFRGDSPMGDYGHVIGAMLNGEINKMLRDVNDPCIDNVRFAALDKSGDMRRYKVRQESGCCGSFDRTVKIMGKKYIVGCNYGH